MIVYPLPESLHPTSFRLELHFLAGSGNRIFRLRAVSDDVDQTFYFTPTLCDADRCRWQIDAAAWSSFVARSPGQGVWLTVAGTSGEDAPVAESDPVRIVLSPEPVRGSFYYFSTKVPGVYKATVTGLSTEANPFILGNSKSNPKDCAGCHTVSADGTKIASIYGHGDDFLGITSTASPGEFLMKPDMTHSNFQSFSPDGSRLISNFGGELILRDGSSGEELGRVGKDLIGGAGRAVMPEWSHDGRNIVFVRMRDESKLFYEIATCCGQKAGGDWLVSDAGDIAILPQDNGVFAPARVLVEAQPSREYHYYPTWSPDDAWVAFNTGTWPGHSPVAQDKSASFSYGIPMDVLVSYDQDTSRLRLVRVTGGPVIELARATGKPGVTASWPRFAPFAQAGGRLLFLTYSSKRDYGFLVGGGKNPQLWMAAIDVGALAAGAADPSYAPVWIPFQDYRETNHQGVWSREAGAP